jgi:hypothetical protein
MLLRGGYAEQGLPIIIPLSGATHSRVTYFFFVVFFAFFAGAFFVAMVYHPLSSLDKMVI